MNIHEPSTDLPKTCIRPHQVTGDMLTEMGVKFYKAPPLAKEP